jgi:hypothetical protein
MLRAGSPAIHNRERPKRSKTYGSIVVPAREALPDAFVKLIEMLPLGLLSPFLLMPAAVWLGRRRAPWAGLLAAWPAGLAVYFGATMRSVAASGPVHASLPWAESLGLTLSFYADGLSQC